jgi:transcriptional regulator with XRE-family HTH domain
MQTQMQTAATAAPAPTAAITIEEMDQDQALEAVREISSRAVKSQNWGLILGANGKSGRSATGNYSLLAKAIGMTRVHVSRVLKGKVQPSHSTLRKLSEVTGISLDEISRFILEQGKGSSLTTVQVENLK